MSAQSVEYTVNPLAKPASETYIDIFNFPKDWYYIYLYQERV